MEQSDPLGYAFPSATSLAMPGGPSIHAAGNKKALQIDDGKYVLQGIQRPMTPSDRLLQLAAAFPVVVVGGAHQVGKTTLVRLILPNHHYVVFDASLDQENARCEPDLFLKNHPPPVILDEIPYALECWPPSSGRSTVRRNRWGSFCSPEASSGRC